MSIGIRDEHEELRSSLQRWVDSHCPPEVTRSALDGDVDALPAFWGGLGAQGTLGIHIDEVFGGQGAGLVELAVTAEVLGRAAAPGPWGTTAVVAAVVAESGDPELAKVVVPRLVGGSVPATLAVPAAAPDGAAVPRRGLTGRHGPGGTLSVSGSLAPLLNGATASAVLAPVATDRGECWTLLELGPGVEVEPLPSFDPSRRSARWDLREVPVAADHVLVRATTTRIRDLALVVALGRGGGRGALVPGHRRRTRPDPAPVRQAHRPVPGGQAPTGRHAGGRGAGGGGGVGRRLGAGPGGSPARRGSRRAR